MPDQSPAHTDRRRAESFGAAADEYDRSNRLVLDPTAQAELRSRLARRIGTAGVDTQNDAVAIVCTPPAAR